MGSALTSPEALRFRNLGGTSCQHALVDRKSGTLKTRVQCTKVTRSAGMIIQHYDFAVHSGTALVFDGSTYFGFFPADALADQVGIREASPYVLTPAEQSLAHSFPLPDRSPFPDRQWRMVERIEALVDDGGPHGLGVIEGTHRRGPEGLVLPGSFPRRPGLAGIIGVGIPSPTP